MKENNKITQDTVIALLSHSERGKQAKALGISRQALHKRLVNHPEIEEFAGRLGTVAENTLTLASIKAAERLVSLIDSPILKVSMQASIEVLDRVGVGKEFVKQNPIVINPKPILQASPGVDNT